MRSTLPQTTMVVRVQSVNFPPQKGILPPQFLQCNEVQERMIERRNEKRGGTRSVHALIGIFVCIPTLVDILHLDHRRHMAAAFLVSLAVTVVYTVSHDSLKIA